MADPGRRVFLAYARSDQGFATRLTRALTRRGAQSLDVAADLQPGDDIEEALLSDLRASDIVVFVIPEREGAGKNALAELGAAYALGKRIVAVAPDTARFHNAEVARLLSGSAIVDASAIPEEALVNAIMTPIAA